MNDKFWITEPSIFIKDNNYLKFIPTKDMNAIGQLNSISLFFIYYLILLFVFDRGNYAFPVLILLGIYVLYSIYKKYPDRKEHLGKNIEKSIEPVFDEEGNQINVEVGQYDPDGNLIFRSESPIDRKLPCKAPNPENPFMNPLVSDYNNGVIPAPCNADDEEIKTEVKGSFNKDLFRDVSDLYDIRNSERQFYTIPAPDIPSRQEDFARWCFGQNDTCKTDQELCLRQEDLRWKYVRY